MRNRISLLTIAVFVLLQGATTPTLHAQPNPTWLRLYNQEGAGGGFGDVAWTRTHRTPGFATCGNLTVGADRWNYMTVAFWVMATDGEGEPFLSERFRDDNIPAFMSMANSVIGTDDNGYLIGGTAQYIDTTNGYGRSYFTVLKVNSNGGLSWMYYYGENPAGSGCQAVIELKGGNYLGCGRAKLDGASGGYATMIEANGDVAWERCYPQTARSLYAVRETDDGFIFAGNGVGVGALVMKTDFNGELQWAHEWAGRFWGLVSSPRGGFVACGTSSVPMRGTAILLVRFNDNGDEIWSQTYDLTDRGDYGRALVALPDGGFLVVGDYSPVPGDGTPCGEMVRTDARGNLMWSRIDQQIGDVQIAEYTSVILDGDGAPVIAGRGRRNVYRGILLGLPAERFAPSILSHFPIELDMTILMGESISFSIDAEDQQDDSLIYRWTLNDETVSDADTATISFPDLGDYSVKCVVSDGVFADSVQWAVHATDLYIQSHSPDTLNLTIRRGVAVDFTIDSVAAVGGNDDVQYLWRKNNLDNQGEPERSGEDAQATISFLQSGNYAVEGLAYRDQSSDEVVWNVAVKGAIWSFAPEDISLEVLPDSLIRFEVVPSEPDSAGWSITWLVDGEVARFDETVLEWRFFGEADSCPPHLVQVVVADSVEADTVTWEVVARELGVGDEEAERIRRSVLLNVSPNPFNSMLTIKYTTGSAARPTRLAIYDVSGREVVRLVDGGSSVNPPWLTGRNSADRRGSPEETSSATWNASSFPAGVYLVRLQTGQDVSTRKVVLIR